MTEEEVDVEALLASINANFENDQNNTQIIPETKNESIVIVNETIKQEAEDIDPIIEILNRVEIQNSLLTNTEINKHQLGNCY